MADSSFELALSDLAHASLADKAPGLMEYLVGFQTLDKNDEETHAVAVFGFKVGNQWFYSPVFFLNGTLKGQELLYVKSQNIFVPLQDNWVNYLISKQPRNLGQSEQVNEKDLRLEGPDFRVFSEPPATSGTKWASALPVNGIQAWARPFLPVYRTLMEGFQKRAADLADRLDLRAVLKRAPALTPSLVSTMRDNLKFAEAVLSFYDLKDLLPDPQVVKQALLDLQPKMQGPQTSLQLPKSAPRVGASLGKKPGEAGFQPAKRPVGDLSNPVKKAELVGDNHQYKTRFLGEYNSLDAVLDSIIWRGKEKKAAAEDEKIQPDDNSPKVEIFTQEDVPTVLTKRDGSATLTDAEKEQLLRGEVVVRDHRTDTSRVYEAEFDRHLTNPTESGVFDVLTNTGKFEKCLVINDPKTVGKGRATGVCTLVSLDGSRYGSLRNIDILIHASEQGANSFQDRFKEVMAKAKPISAMKSGYLYVLIGPDAVGSIPFKFLTQVARNDGTTVYAVKPKTHVQRGKNNVRSTLSHYSDGFRMQEGIYLEDFDSDYDNCAPAIANEDYDTRTYSEWDLQTSRQLIVSDKDRYSQLKSVAGCTFVPSTGWKVLEIGPDPDNRRAVKANLEIAKTFEPGCLLDAETYILKLGAQDLIVQKDGTQFVVRHEAGQQRLTKTAALKHLVCDWRMRAEDARMLVKRAEEQRLVQCFVKLAQGGLDAPPGGPVFPPYMTTYNTQLGVPIQEQQTDFVNLPGMQPDFNNRFEYKLMDDPEVQHALTAADKGQKDVFDTSVMSGLVKAVDVDSMVDSFLPDMIKGMDRVGHVLFLFYWHNDNFRERYGRQELSELEDSLRNVFKSTGDLVLFLKQKSVDADPMTDAIDIDLKSITG